MHMRVRCVPRPDAALIDSVVLTLLDSLRSTHPVVVTAVVDTLRVLSSDVGRLATAFATVQCADCATCLRASTTTHWCRNSLQRAACDG